MIQRRAVPQSNGAKRRGRPRRIEPRTVVESADTYGGWLRQYWPKIGHRLLAANSAEEITQAIQQETPDVSASLVPLSPLMLTILQERRFPGVRSEAQIQFLADSMGGQGLVTARRSREICSRERKKVVRYVILRREFYIECSCGYKGPALNGACRKCYTAELSSDLLVE